MPLDGSIPKRRFVHWKRSGDGRLRPTYRRVRPDETEFRRPLPPDPNDPAYERAYQVAEREYQEECARLAGETPKANSVRHAIVEYRQSAAYLNLPANTRRQYRIYLDLMEVEFGGQMMRSMNFKVLDDLRTKFFKAGMVNQWNETRKVMRIVTDKFMLRHELVVPFNYWAKVGRLRVETPEGERAHRPWPDEVIVRVFRAATPNFRALLYCYLFTGQRGSDVTRFGNAEVRYDPDARVLQFTQVKGRKRMSLPVPETLHRLLTAEDGRTLLLTPRGRAWNTLNAQETLRTLLTNLGLERYTLHGLRSTVAASLGELGFSELVLMTQCGWEESRTVRQYTRGHQQRQTLAPVPAALELRFGPLVREAEIGATDRRFSGVTGRAAAATGVERSAKRRAREAREAREQNKKGS